jgi:uncharacterized membrane protein (UPF0127 family)
MSYPYIYSPKIVNQQLTRVVCTVLLLLFCGAGLAQTIELRLGQAGYEIELAKTPRQRQAGLMHREYLSPRQGMLLIYPRAGNHRIWMKNMLIPLRVYWIDENFTVLDMQRLQPCSASPCPVYSVAGKTRYILELGDYEHPLVRGDRIEALNGF